ncbi:MAG: hypothetical protein JW885_01070 [Deltaproteobacteria bacterium]|nr:hypothetical protein [Candidatus Zymogenaceae bacterium]
MKRITHKCGVFASLVALGVTLVIASPARAVTTVSIDQPGSFTVSAGIDGSCMPAPLVFTIGEGLTAKDFKVSSIDSGYNCVTGAPSDLMGFEIESNGQDIHSETIYSNRPPDVYYQPLSKLILQPGAYTLYAYGGRSAYVVLEMTVESIASTPTPTPPGGTTPSVPSTPGGTTTPSPTSPGGNSGPVATTFGGGWNTDWWGRLNLTVSGNSVSGTYEESAGRVTGTLSADGKTIDGWWSEAPDYDPPGSAGKFVLTLSANAQSFTGWWCFGNSTESSFTITGSRIE